MLTYCRPFFLLGKDKGAARQQRQARHKNKHKNIKSPKHPPQTPLPQLHHNRISIASQLAILTQKQPGLKHPHPTPTIVAFSHVQTINMPTLAGYIAPGYNIPAHASRPIRTYQMAPSPTPHATFIPEPKFEVAQLITGLALFVVHLHGPDTLSLLWTFAFAAPLLEGGFHMWKKLRVMEAKRQMERLRRCDEERKKRSEVLRQEDGVLRWKANGLPALRLALLKRQMTNGGGRNVEIKETVEEGYLD
jgi:hypothetical protein